MEKKTPILKGDESYDTFPNTEFGKYKSTCRNGFFYGYPCFKDEQQRIMNAIDSQINLKKISISNPELN